MCLVAGAESCLFWGKMLNALYIAVVRVLLFSSAVVVHEVGHLCMALKCGLRVASVALGFGPKLCSWEWRGIRFSIRWLPLGGFVRIPQMEDSAVQRGLIKGQPRPQVPALNKILVLVAGSLMNLIFAFVLAIALWCVGLPVLVSPPIIGETSTAPEQGIRPGDRILEVDHKQVDCWDDVQTAAMLARTNLIAIMVARSNSVAVYFVPALTNREFSLQSLNLVPSERLTIKSVEPGGPADRAGIRAQDEIVSVNLVSISDHEQFASIVRRSPAHALNCRIKRGTCTLNVTIPPALDKQSKAGRLGLLMDVHRWSFYEIQHVPRVKQVTKVVQRIVGTVKGLFNPSKSGLGVKDLSGIPGILTMLAAEAKVDIRLAISFLIMLNINLAIINLLPVPILDGGHVVIVMWEKMRKPLSSKWVLRVNGAVAVLLLSLMMYVSYNDLLRWKCFCSMFKNQPHIAAQHPATQKP
jgi:regulator of sigma E protease